MNALGLDATVGLAALALLAASAGALALAGIAAAVGRLARDERRPAARVAIALGSLGLAVAAFGASLVTIDRHGFDLPYWDGWEEADWYTAFHAGSLRWRDLLAPHNEHRIVLTRALAILVESANGQWDNRLQTVANAAVHALAAVAVAAGAGRGLGRAGLAVVALLAALAGGLPFGRENALWGFQSQFYFEILFSTLAVALAAGSRPWSVPWALGMACAAAAPFTLGAGALAPLAIAAVAALETVRARGGRGRSALAAGAAGALALAALAAIQRPVGNDALGAHGAAELATSFVRCAAWPAVDKPWLAPVLWLPCALLFAVHLRRREHEWPQARVLLGLGGWVLLHCAAIAVSRGARGAGPANRYVDILAVGVVVNAAAAFALAGRAAAPARRRVAAAVAVAWLALPWVQGYRYLGRVVRTQVWVKDEERRAQVASVRAFVATDDDRALRGKPPRHVPYPAPDRLASLLRDARVRRILPPSVREPIALTVEDAGPFAAARPGGEPALRGAWRCARDPCDGAWRARPAAPTALPYVAIATDGDPTRPGCFLGLEGEAGSHPASRTGAAPPGWLGWAVRRPGEGGGLAARTRAGSGFAAFTEPVELGALSFWSERLLGAGAPVAACGIALVAAAAGLVARASSARRR